MKPLHARSRALIDAARPAEEPSHDDRARVRARVMASLAGAAAAVTATSAAEAGAASGTAAATGTGAASGTTAATGAVTGSAVAGGAAASSGVAKAVIIGALLGLFASGTAELVLPPPGPAAPPATMAAPGLLPRPPGATSSTAIAPTPPAEETAATPGPAPSEAPVRSAARPDPTPSAPAAAASVREEVELLKDAQRAIVAGETDRALALLDTHATRFEAGSFREERLAARAIALCGAARDAAARRAVAELFAAAPGSQLEGRVRAACARVLSGEPEKK